MQNKEAWNMSSASWQSWIRCVALIVLGLMVFVTACDTAYAEAAVYEWGCKASNNSYGATWGSGCTVPGGGVAQAVLATGTAYPDALSIAPYSAAKKLPTCITVPIARCVFLAVIRPSPKQMSLL